MLCDPRLALALLSTFFEFIFSQKSLYFHWLNMDVRKNIKKTQKKTKDVLEAADTFSRGVLQIFVSR